MSNKKDGGDEVDQEYSDDFVTKKYVFEMLKVQESLLRNLFHSMLANVNSSIDGMIKDLKELKSSLQFSGKDIEDLKPLTEQMTKIEKEIGEAKLKCVENEGNLREGDDLEDGEANDKADLSVNRK